MSTTKCCGTCRHWKVQRLLRVGKCEFKLPTLPVWVSIAVARGTHNWYGSDCEVWEPRKKVRKG